MCLNSLISSQVHSTLSFFSLTEGDQNFAYVYSSETLRLVFSKAPSVWTMAAQCNTPALGLFLICVCLSHKRQTENMKDIY